jgi:peptide/nickel transport system substrate-binding protein
MQIASHLAAGLEAAGIDYRLTPTDPQTLYQEVLFGHEFDIYIARFPQTHPPDPDMLYPLLHSTMNAELGWQNPFGFTNVNCDELLAAQRSQQGATRRETVDDLQMLLGETQPFVPIYLLEIVTCVQTARFSGWETAVDRMPYGLLGLQAVTPGSSRLRLASNDSRITANRNPISAAHHSGHSLLDLLYDPLVVADGDRRYPWLATAVDWESDPLEATIDLREGLTWHDGEPLTAADVAFTYRFLADTARGSTPNPIPAPRFRGESTLVSAVTVENESQLTIEFVDTTQTVAEQAFTLPILPAHIWRAYTDSASVVGIGAETTTEALFWDNQQPIGSGPLRFSEATAGEELVLSRFDNHFLTTTDDERLGDYRGGPAFEELVVETVASYGGTVELVATGNADATLTPIDPQTVPEISDISGVEIHTHRSHAMYHLGFNSRRQPLSNPNLRRLVARLVDKAFLVENRFEGYGEPVSSPLAATDWLATEVEWTGQGDPVVPFIGTDGTVDSEAAREAFREVGFRYNDEGELLASSN